MLNLSLAGNVGRDAAYKQTQGGQELCSFPVAVNIGYGDNKSTIWVDVSRWGKGAKGLADILRKGSRVAVTGQMSTREYEGKTYIQCNAHDVTIMGDAGGGQRGDGNAKQATQDEDLNDDVPF